MHCNGSPHLWNPNAMQLDANCRSSDPHQAINMQNILTEQHFQPVFHIHVSNICQYNIHCLEPSKKAEPVVGELLFIISLSSVVWDIIRQALVQRVHTGALGARSTEERKVIVIDIQVHTAYPLVHLPTCRYLCILVHTCAYLCILVRAY